MKKFVTALAVIIGLLSIAPLSLALSGINNKEIDTMYVEAPKINKAEKSLISVDEDEEITYIKNNDKNSRLKSEKNNESEDALNVKNNSDKEKYVIDKGKSVNDINTNESKNNDVYVDPKVSNRKEDIISDINSKSEIKYSYAGDEKDFNILSEKGYEGYVYSPEGNSDLGIFVDKNTNEKYYFHPSGYLEVYE